MGCSSVEAFKKFKKKVTVPVNCTVLVGQWIIIIIIIICCPYVASRPLIGPEPTLSGLENSPTLSLTPNVKSIDMKLCLLRIVEVSDFSSTTADAINTAKPCLRCINRFTRRHYKAVHLKVISYFRERWVRGEFAPKSNSLKQKELGCMRKDFDSDQLRLLLIYRLREDDWLSWPE